MGTIRYRGKTKTKTIEWEAVEGEERKGEIQAKSQQCIKYFHSTTTCRARIHTSFHVRLRIRMQ